MSTFAPLERFTIRGLHGYKDLSIEFAGKSTVVVAENGTGKTTLLNALNAFLTRRFHRLNSIDFTSIECKFEDALLPISLSKNQLTAADPGSIEQLRELANSASVSEAELTDFLQNTYVLGEIERFRNLPIVRQLYLSLPSDWQSLGQVLDEVRGSVDNTLTEAAKAISAELRARFEDIEILFFPTYRRIERPLLRESKGKRAHGSFRRRFPDKAEHDDMAFGLSDVQFRLAQLSEDIERRSNLEYRSLSARMLEDLLRDRGARPTDVHSELPDIDSLTRFLSRVRHGHGSDSDLFDRIKRLYASGRISHADNWFLRYFLDRLSQVIEETQEAEYVIEEFVSVCNSYLTLSSDEKFITFDPMTLRVVVQDVWAGRPIDLDDLSSGEKQIVSLMAKLYLSPRRKLVLIDEPELSLSLDWQRKVLPDIVNSPTVIQMLAITHSPFVFENELDQCARPLIVKRAGVKNGAD